MKRERAYVEGRRHQVLEMLQRNPQVRVDELAKRLGVSVVTLRRDLQFLEEKKQIRRFYGGASVSKDADGYMDDVAVYRDLIARYAATLVEDGDTIFLSSGNIIFNLAKRIKHRQIIAVTPSIRAALALSKELTRLPAP